MAFNQLYVNKEPVFGVGVFQNFLVQFDSGWFQQSILVLIRFWRLNYPFLMLAFFLRGIFRAWESTQE